MKKVVLCACVLVPVSAHAETPRYVATSGLVSLDRYGRIGASAEAGASKGPIGVHVLLASGVARRFSEAGGFMEARAGLETRECFDSGCAFEGIDLSVDRAYLHDTDGWATPHETVDTAMIVPRIGFEGGRTLTWRAVVEIPFLRDGAIWPNVGAGLQLGGGYRW